MDYPEACRSAISQLLRLAKDSLHSPSYNRDITARSSDGTFSYDRDITSRAASLTHHGCRWCRALSASAVMVCPVCSMPDPRRWHAKPTETIDAQASCGRIGHCSNPRPINQSDRVLGFGLIADRAMGTIRSIIPHRRRMAQRIAPSNQSDQSFFGSFGRTKSIASIGLGIVDGIPIGPINATNRESRRSG